METDDAATPDLEVDQGAIVQLLTERGLDEGQPEQVAGRWIEAGYEDASEIARLIDSGVTDPEQARAQNRSDTVGPGERHDEEKEPRDVARGAAGSRSRPGDDLEQEPQQPGSPP